jgi:outer membrane receptor for ferrienterochelin and colicins
LSFVICPLSFAADLPLFYAEEVVVTATRIPRLPSSIPWNTKLITREEIEESLAVKLGDILRSTSGLSVKANGGLNSQISARLRGSNSQQVLVLLNGNRINSPSLGMFDLGDILLTDVERIEVVKAPLSAVYGADAVGGVVNIITKGATERPELRISASCGEYETQNYSVNGSGSNYFFSAASLSSSGFRDNSDYKAQDFNVRFSGKYLEAGIKKYDAEKGSPGSLDFLTPQARQSDKNLFYDLNYKVEKIGLKAALSQSLLDQKYENPAWGILSTHKTTTTNLNIQEVIDWFPSHTFVLGGEIRSDKSESTNSGNHELSNSAVYAQDEIEIPGFAKIILGGREDMSSAYGNHFNPRVGCVFNPWKDILFKVSWGTSFKAPTIDDLYWTKTTEPGWPTGLITTEGNPNLKSETAQSFDVSLERRFNPQSSARLSYYLTKIKDMIRWTNISASLTDAYWRPTNVSNASIQGVEFEYEREILDKLRGFMNFTYQSAKDENSDKFLDYAPQTQYNAGVKYLYKAGLTSNFVVKYVGERYADLANTTKLPGYTVVDLSLTRDIGHWMLRLDIENLFDESYAETYGFTDVYPMPGRRYNIGVSYKI